MDDRAKEGGAYSTTFKGPLEAIALRMCAIALAW